MAHSESARGLSAGIRAISFGVRFVDESTNFPHESFAKALLIVGKNILGQIYGRNETWHTFIIISHLKIAVFIGQCDAEHTSHRLCQGAARARHVRNKKVSLTKRTQRTQQTPLHNEASAKCSVVRSGLGPWTSPRNRRARTATARDCACPCRRFRRCSMHVGKFSNNNMSNC